jgi:hypothetical protein
MTTHSMRRITVWLFVLLVVASRSHADEMSRVRTESTDLRGILAEARRSPTVSALIEQIDASNVIAHLECAHFKSVTLEGRTFFVLARHDVRYVRVQIDCMLMRPQLMVIVGHELQHVAEIAAAPDVVDERAFAGLLKRIGFLTCRKWPEQYETEAALAIEERVYREMSRPHGVPNPFDGAIASTAELPR